MSSKVKEYTTYIISAIILLSYLSLLVFGVVCLVSNFNEFSNLKSNWIYCLVNILIFLTMGIKFNSLTFMINNCFFVIFIFNTCILIWGLYELFIFNSKIDSNISTFTLITFIIYSIFEILFLIYLFLYCYAKICLIKTPCCCLFKKCRVNDDIVDDIELQNLNSK